MLNTRSLALTATLAMLTMLVSVPALANAAPVTHVCIAAANTEVCPRTAPNFTGATVGSTFSIFVSFADKIPFNTFDIIVSTNPAFLNPLAAKLVPESVLTGSVIKYCVNGVDQIGGGCGAQDTSGTLEFFIGSTSFSGAGHLSKGPLFQVDFHVVAIPTAPITIGFQTGCSPSSLPPPSTTCVLVANGGTSPLPVAFAQTATFI